MTKYMDSNHLLFVPSLSRQTMQRRNAFRNSEPLTF